jgi:GT2 family glycosyltransferase
MPTYNGASYLSAALESIAIQLEKDIEVIVVDDGSTDRTISIIRAYTHRFPLRIVERNHSGNWVANTNMGLSLARGEYVSFLHQDDFWLPGRLKTLRLPLVTAPSVVMALHPSWYVDGQGRRLGLWRCPLPNGQGSLNSAKVIERLLVQNFISIPAPIFRREAAIRVGGMDESLWYTADWDLWLKLVAVGDIIYISNPLSCFRVHAYSQTIQRSGKTDFRSQLEIVLQRHLSKWEMQYPTRQIISKVARFSVELNVALAAKYHERDSLPVRKLLISWIALGLLGWYLFMRNSRIIERTMARLKMSDTGRRR